MRSFSRWLLLLLFILTIPLAAQQTPFSGVIPIPGTIQAENFDNGGQTVSWSDSAAGNAFGAVYRSNIDVDVGQIAAGQYHIGALEAGEWVEYTVNVSTAGTYNIVVRYASGYTGPTTFNMVLNGTTNVFTTNQSVGYTGGWSAYTTSTYTGSLPAGTHVLRVNFVSGFWNPDSFAFSLASTCVTPVTITQSPASKSVFAGATWTFQGTATGNPAPQYQWYKNGVAIPGQTAATLRLTNIEHGKDAGSYHFTASNSCGTKTSAAATLTVRCDGPEDVLEILVRHIQGSTYERCNWVLDVQPGFPTNFGNGQSYNIPVAAAAVAIVKQPIRASNPSWNMYSWWTTYLEGELGDRPPPAWYYGGQEIGSNDYQAYNVISVLVAHRYANLAGTQGDIAETLAWRWLRTTFTLQALSASQQQPLSLHAKGQQFIPSTPYDGPYIGAAGERTPWGFWMDPDRSVMLAEAIGWATNKAGELNYQKIIREHVDDWAGLYPFTATEKTALRNTIINGTPPPGLAALIGTKLRSQKRYHLVGWSDVKVTLLEENTNTQTAPTYGVAYFRNPKFTTSGREAHFLYPWQGLWNFPPPPQEERRHRHQIVPGFATLNLPLRFMEAWHPDSPPAPNDPNGPPTHPAETVRIDGLPSTAPLYHVTLRPDNVPLIVCTPGCS